jgi:hypothetical protein
LVRIGGGIGVEGDGDDFDGLAQGGGWVFDAEGAEEAGGYDDGVLVGGGVGQAGVVGKGVSVKDGGGEDLNGGELLLTLVADVGGEGVFGEGEVDAGELDEVVEEVGVKRAWGRGVGGAFRGRGLEVAVAAVADISLFVRGVGRGYVDIAEETVLFEDFGEVALNALAEGEHAEEGADADGDAGGGEEGA